MTIQVVYFGNSINHEKILSRKTLMNIIQKNLIIFTACITSIFSMFSADKTFDRYPLATKIVTQYDSGVLLINTTHQTPRDIKKAEKALLNRVNLARRYVTARKIAQEKPIEINDSIANNLGLKYYDRYTGFANHPIRLLVAYQDPFEFHPETN